MKTDIKSNHQASHIKRTRYRRLELIQYIKAGWSKEKTAQHHGLTIAELEEALKEKP